VNNKWKILMKTIIELRGQFVVQRCVWATLIRADHALLKVIQSATHAQVEIQQHNAAHAQA
jgi:hypothetical protein